MTDKSQPKTGKKQGECHMCGLVKELSKEHFFPVWMREIQPIEKTGMVNYTTGIQKTREVGTFTVNQICTDCNGGWMSRLQSAAKPIIAPRLISNDFDKLTEAEAYIIAQWFVMTTMVCEKDNSGGFMGTSAEERQEFSKNQVVPDHWQVWMGRWPEKESRGFSHAPGKIVDGSGNVLGRTQSFVMLAGKVILLSFSGRWVFHTAYLGTWNMQRLFPKLDERANPPSYPFPLGFHPRVLNDVVAGKVKNPTSVQDRGLGFTPIHPNAWDKI